jgi:hypothetical protein
MVKLSRRVSADLQRTVAMRRILTLSLLSLAAIGAVAPAAEAQGRRNGGALTLNVRPRSWLNAGNVIEPGAQVNPASAYGQYVSYQNLPPWISFREAYGEDRLPDPVTNGPFVGARNPIGPVDFVAPDFLR